MASIKSIKDTIKERFHRSAGDSTRRKVSPIKDFVPGRSKRERRAEMGERSTGDTVGKNPEQIADEEPVIHTAGAEVPDPKEIEDRIQQVEKEYAKDGGKKPGEAA